MKTKNSHFDSYAYVTPVLHCFYSCLCLWLYLCRIVNQALELTATIHLQPRSQEGKGPGNEVVVTLCSDENALKVKVH